MSVSDPARPERTWIRAKLRAVLRKKQIGLLPAALEALVDEVWSICETERATSAILVVAAHDQFGPLDDLKVQALARVIEMREEHAPGKCTVGGAEFSTDAVVPPRPRR